MGQSYRVISVIPARGGSKGLPGKNTLDLGGKPLIAHTIEASLGCKSIHRTIVSTDSPKIAEIAKGFGAEVPFLRPADLSGDTAKSADVVLHAIRFLESQENDRYDIVLMLQPTSPLRTAKHIEEAIAKFVKTPDLDSLISITENTIPPWWLMNLEGEKIKMAFPLTDGKSVFTMGRQALPKTYLPNGAIYITWSKHLVNTGNLVNPENCGYSLMDGNDSIDIDYKSDLLLAQAILDERE